TCGRLPTEGEAGRDADLFAEADLRDVAVDRARIEPVPLDQVVERAGCAERPLEHVTLGRGVDVIPSPRLAFELRHPPWIDAEIQLAQLRRLDSNGLDAHRRPESPVVRVDAVVALKDGSDAADPRAPEPARDGAEAQEIRHRIQHGF